MGPPRSSSTGASTLSPQNPWPFPIRIVFIGRGSLARRRKVGVLHVLRGGVDREIRRRREMATETVERTTRDTEAGLSQDQFIEGLNVDLAHEFSAVILY